MKKVYIYTESYTGCYYYRAEVFKRYSKEFIVKTNIDRFGRVTKLRDCFSDMAKSDLVILLRPSRKELYFAASFLKNLGKKVIFSTDDSFSTIDKKNPAAALRKRANISHHILSICDAAIVTNKCLKEELQEYNQSIFIVPNYIDFDEVSSKYSEKKNNHKIRIGLTGSVQTAENIERFTKVLEKVLTENKNVQLIFFGNDDTKSEERLKEQFKENVIFESPVKFSKYPARLASLHLDIALIPRKDNFFNRCKSNCKYLEMAALRIAVIAQAFEKGDSPYQKDIDGSNGLLAQTPNEWLMAIRSLVRDSDKRKKIVHRAYSYVQENYDIKSKVKEWDDTISKIAELPPSQPSYNPKMLFEGYNTLNDLTELFEKLRKDRNEIEFLNKEIDRIRNNPLYRTATVSKKVIKKIKPKGK